MILVSEFLKYACAYFRQSGLMIQNKEVDAQNLTTISSTVYLFWVIEFECRGLNTFFPFQLVVTAYAYSFTHSLLQ